MTLVTSTTRSTILLQRLQQHSYYISPIGKGKESEVVLVVLVTKKEKLDLQ